MSTSNFDAVRFNESRRGPQVPSFTYRNRRFIEVRDQQGGQYTSGQIFFDLSTLVSNNTFVDWQSSYITIPYTTTVTMTAGAVANQIGFDSVVANLGASWTLKNSNYMLINGMTIVLGNQTVVPYQQLSNIPIVHKLLTSWNENDVAVLGASINFAKDSSDSIFMNTTAFASAYEDNSFYQRPLNNCVDTNNAAVPVAVGPINQWALPFAPGNAGRWKRAMQQVTRVGVTIDPLVANQINMQYTGLSGFVYGTGFIDNAKLANTQSNRVVAAGQTSVSPGAADYNFAIVPSYSYAMVARLPTRFLHDLFDKMPLVRGALWQLTLYVHLPCTWSTTYAAISHGENQSVVAYNSLPTSVVATNFCPFMVTPASVRQAVRNNAAYATGNCIVNASGAGLAAGACAISVSSSINAVSGACCMYVCMCDLDNGPATAYMENPIKTVVYQDFIRVQTSGMINQIPGGQMRATITSGMGNLRKLLIFPYLPASMTNGVSSCGATGLPYFSATACQLYYSGRPLYDKPIDYTFDMFWRENLGSGAADGCAQDGMRVGLIDQSDFRTGYTPMVFNLQRHAADSDSVPVSLDIEFTTNWGDPEPGAIPTISFLAFLFFDREFKIDCLTGRLT